MLISLQNLIKNQIASRLVANLFFAILSLFLLLTVIVLLKKQGQKKEVYITTSITKANWWESTSPIPLNVFDSIKPGTYFFDDEETEIVNIKYFYTLRKNWEEDRVGITGEIVMKVQADQQGSELFFQNQNLLVGNPIVITDDSTKTRIELLITKIGDTFEEKNYQPILVIAKQFEKKPELIDHFNTDIEIKDNNEKTYMKILSAKSDNTPILTRDIYGNVFKSKDPTLYDLEIKVEVLAIKDELGNIFGYDGRPISIGSPLIINNPLFRNFDFYIIDVEEQNEN